MKSFSTLMLAAEIGIANAITFSLDCSRVPQACNNDCYGIYTFGKEGTLNWNMPTATTTETMRKNAGCDPTPCGGSESFEQNPEGTSCDEYPYASTTQGGTGSVLRCIDEGQNKLEGSLLGGFLARGGGGGCNRMPCQFDMAFINYDASVPFCNSRGSPNDGYEFELIAGNYELASRDSNGTQAWRPSNPDPSLLFPAHMRREFLMANGMRVLHSTRNLTRDLIGESVFFDDTADGVSHIVRELFGAEKSPGLRPIGLDA